MMYSIENLEYHGTHSYLLIFLLRVASVVKDFSLINFDWRAMEKEREDALMTTMT